MVSVVNVVNVANMANVAGTAQFANTPFGAVAGTVTTARTVVVDVICTRLVT